MEQDVGMDNRIIVIHMGPVILLSIILWGCSRGEPTRAVEQNQAPAINVAIDAQTPALPTSAQTAVDAHRDKKPDIIKGGEVCEGYLLKKITKEKAEDGRQVKLEAFNTGDEALSPDLKEWLETKDKQTLVVFKLRNTEKEALILGSYNTKATGIASNFQNWYVRLGSHSLEFLSLSEDPRLIFWDRNGLLNYYVITYGSKFLENRDWENLTLNLLRYRVSPNGESQLVSEERNMRCE
jgi:hypothetical protein